jgi:hypothetical protein
MDAMAEGAKAFVEGAIFGAQPEPWSEPCRTILHRSSSPPPDIPLEVFGRYWASWIITASRGANAPADYTAMPLIALVSALLGNSRWPVAWQGWTEPPILWLASVGNPSSGKSSGATPINRDVMAVIERYMSRDYPKQVEDWETVASVAKAVLKQWEKDVAKSVKSKGEQLMPEKPREALVPPKPIRPRAKVMDVTVEKLATILESAPKGVLYVRDELASFMLNLSRYSNGGTDRPFWLEAYVGGPMQVDRVKNPDPVFISHLVAAMFGTIQPDRLEEILSGADDGLASRYLWSWPTAKPFEQPRGAADIQAAADRLLRIADLQMVKSEAGELLPAYIHLSPDARVVLTDFARDMQTRENIASPLVKSSLGKARGQALRLSIVLEYLWWSATPAETPEPGEISLAAMQAAAGLMDAYFLPMGARVLGDSAIPLEERNARTLAAWLIARRPERINVSMIRDEARLNNLRETGSVKQACKFLEDARWLREVPLTGGRGRPRGDYLVNPILWECAQ